MRAVGCARIDGCSGGHPPERSGSHSLGRRPPPTGLSAGLSGRTTRGVVVVDRHSNPRAQSRLDCGLSVAAQRAQCVLSSDVSGGEGWKRARRGEYTEGCRVGGGKIPVPRSRRGWRFSRVFERENVKIQAHPDIGVNRVFFSTNLSSFLRSILSFFFFFSKRTGFTQKISSINNKLGEIYVIRFYFFELDTWLKILEIGRNVALEFID